MTQLTHRYIQSKLKVTNNPQSYSTLFHWISSKSMTCSLLCQFHNPHFDKYNNYSKTRLIKNNKIQLSSSLSSFCMCIGEGDTQAHVFVCAHEWRPEVTLEWHSSEAICLPGIGTVECTTLPGFLRECRRSELKSSARTLPMCSSP